LVTLFTLRCLKHRSNMPAQLPQPRSAYLVWQTETQLDYAVKSQHTRWQAFQMIGERTAFFEDSHATTSPSALTTDAPVNHFPRQMPQGQLYEGHCQVWHGVCCSRICSCQSISIQQMSTRLCKILLILKGLGTPTHLLPKQVKPFIEAY
jgi:hypothetical protein